MANDWTELPLSEITDFKNGKGLNNTLYDDNGRYPVWGSNGQIARTDELLNDNSVVVIGRVGAYCGSVHAVPEPNWVTDNAIIATPKDDNDFRFLYYLLKFLKPERTSIGSAQPLITQTGLKTLKHIIPDPPEQRAIAHILGTLDDKIELNRKMNETLEEIARAIFKSWFVDFDPVHAKAEGRDPGLPKEIADLFPDSFEESELGQIPKGWTIGTIGDAVRCVGGSTPSTKEPLFWQGGTNSFVTPKDMSSLSSPVILHTERHITDAGVKKISSGQLPNKTLLLSSRAPIGYLGIAEIPISINQGIIAMICDRTLPVSYVIHWVETNMDDIKANASGTTFPEISKRNFRPLKVLIPSEEVLIAYDKLVEPTYRQIVNNLKESRTLVSIRDTLIPKLISGNLRVAEAEKVTEVINYD